MQNRKTRKLFRPDTATVHHLNTERMFRTHREHLAAWLRKRFGDGPPEPDDIVQAAFEKMAGMASLDHVENKRAFLFTIAANIAISGIRHRKRSEDYIDENLANHDVLIEKLTPERVLEGKDRFKSMEKALSDLSDRQADILTRHRLLGQTYTHISEETGWSIGTISAEIRSALKFLTRSMDADSLGDDA